MNPHVTRFLFLAAAGVGLTWLSTSPAAGVFLNSSGPPVAHAAEPPNFTNCTACHFSNPVNSGDGALTISGVPASYTGGTTYNLTVTVQDPGQSRWGFELVPMFFNRTRAGTLMSTDARTRVIAGAGGLQYVQHTLSGTSAGVMNGPVSWNFNWTAPVAGSGTAFFYFTGNAANNSGNELGDFIYSQATASADASLASEATIVLQPDSPRPRRNGQFVIHARIRNHLGAANTLTAASRVILASGNPFPATGPLLPPVTVTVPAGGDGNVDFVHPVSATTPLITATYMGAIGHAPSTLVDTDTFTFTVTP